MKPTEINFDTLFDPSFLAEVSRWRIVARRTAPGGYAGVRLSPSEGAGMEFKNFRPYTPGDDLRSIDWNLYRRLGKAYSRRYEEERNLPVYLLPDISGSMRHAGLDATTPLMAALRLTLGLAAMVTHNQDTLSVFPFHERMETAFQGRCGYHQLIPLGKALAGIANISTSPTTNLPATLHTWSALGLRRGLVVILSDFFDPAGPEAIAEAINRLPHRVLLIQICRSEDSKPALTESARLVDAETGEHIDIEATDEATRTYLEAYSKFNNTLRKAASARGGSVLRVDISAPLLPQLYPLLASQEVEA